jgi:N6-adenosine-specific RNA methylase IME4
MLDELPRKRFGAILVDAPWHFKTWSAKGRNRCPDNKHYRTMPTEKIAQLDVRRLAKPNCVLFMWATWPMLNEALWVIADWGFVYKTCAFSWTKGEVRSVSDGGDPEIKLWSGTGYWTRANTEVCLLATRGAPKRKHRDVAQAILSPRREHSRKPDEIHARIERLVAGPYLELFARQKRKGWTVWGEEVDKFS